MLLLDVRLVLVLKRWRHYIYIIMLLTMWLTDEQEGYIQYSQTNDSGMILLFLCVCTLININNGPDVMYYGALFTKVDKWSLYAIKDIVRGCDFYVKEYALQSK